MFSVFLVVVFLVAVCFWYSPVIFKGNSVELMTEEVVLARNYALTGKYAMENKLNVVVSPENVAADAQPSTVGNKFSAISFSLIFKLFGWQNWNNLVLISTIICAIGLVFFTLAVYEIFGLPIALIFPFIYIFLPFNAQTAQYVGFMEFALLYFSLFAFFYAWSRKAKYKYACLLASGIFLGLACLTREAFLIFLPTLFFWLIFKKKFSELFIVFAPIGLLLLFFWLPSMIGAGSANDYSKIFFATDQSSQAYSDFHYYGHVYLDPYTYHFDRQRVIDQFNADLSKQNSNWLYRIDRLKTGQNIGIRGIGLLDRFIVGTSNLASHSSRFFAIEYIGGPLIIILMLYGFWAIRTRDKEIFGLFLFWLVGNFLIISFVVLAIRNHLMDYGWIIAALVASGLADLPALLENYFQMLKYRKIVTGLIVLSVVYSLILANHVYFGRGYDGNRNLCLEYLAQKVQDKNISDADVIAVGNSNAHPILNYLTGKAVVYFDPATVIRLANENKLQDAFDKFGVKYVAGFDASTTDLIIKYSSSTNISSWPDSEKINAPVSYNKMWLLNLIK